MQTRVFVSAQDVNYASSKTSSTVNTALNPLDLAEGAIGIYGVHQAGSTNKDKLVLITDGGSESAGVVPAANFVGERVSFFIGRPSGADKQGIMDLVNMKVTSQAYVAPVKAVELVGWGPNNTTGTLNLPATILYGEEAVLKVVPIKDASENDRTGQTYSGYAGVDGDNAYNILKSMIDNINLDDDRLIDADILGDGTVTESAEDATVTNGSDVVTFAGNVTIATGAFLFVRNRIYQVAAGVTGGTSITLDRPYRGATETIDVSATTDLVGTVASTTNYGLEVQQKNNDVPVSIAVDELIRSATTANLTAYVEGIGTGAKVYQEELDARPLYGNLDNRERVVPIKDLSTNQNLNYDQYFISAPNVRTGSDPHNANYATASTSELLLAFDESLADSAGKNQSDLEDILIALGISVATLF